MFCRSSSTRLIMTQLALEHPLERLAVFGIVPNIFTISLQLLPMF